MYSYYHGDHVSYNQSQLYLLSNPRVPRSWDQRVRRQLLFSFHFFFPSILFTCRNDLNSSQDRSWRQIGMNDWRGISVVIKREQPISPSCKYFESQRLLENLFNVIVSLRKSNDVLSYSGGDNNWFHLRNVRVLLRDIKVHRQITNKDIKVHRQITNKNIKVPRQMMIISLQRNTTDTFAD